MGAASQLSDAFAALADPTRRDIVGRLSMVDEATVTELAAPYDMTIQAVSKHVGVLEEAGLVTRRRDAQRRPVRLDGQVLSMLTGWLERTRRRAEERYARLDEVLADLAVADATTTAAPADPDAVTTSPDTTHATDATDARMSPPGTEQP